MVVLVSFALVLAAAVTLVVGLLQSGLTLIYVSIACSVVAGLVLALAVLRGRPEPKPASFGGAMSPPAAAAPAPTRSFERAPEPTPEPATVGGGWGSSSQTVSTPPPPPPPPPPAAARPSPQDPTQAAGAALLGRLRRKSGQAEPAAAEPPDAREPDTSETFVAEAPPAPGDATGQIGAMPAAAGEGFPIPDYERLRATDIIGRLESLDRGQLEQVRERESATKNRFTVMNRIDARLEEAQEPEWEIADAEWDEGPTEGEVGDREFAEVDVVVEAGRTGDAGFPIPDYGALRVSQILPLLATLSPAERDQVRQREEQGRARSTVLDRIRRLDSGAGGVGAIVLPPPPPPPPPPAPAKRARKASPKLFKSGAAPETAPVRKAAVVAAPKKAAAKARKATPAPTKAAPTKAAPPKAAPTKAAAQKAVKAAGAARATKTTAKASRSTKAGATAEPSSKRAAAIKKVAKKAR